ncbi:MAG: hypothetical protein MRERV_38c005 [Mycoplasmataceae bacterium RV_VA103A]|nr:MAG: hypothetical protein MRERV_38c005 [Mycoplasmataceae bacterium RV_VA103A]
MYPRPHKTKGEGIFGGGDEVSEFKELCYLTVNQPANISYPLLSSSSILRG